MAKNYASLTSRRIMALNVWGQSRDDLVVLTRVEAVSMIRFVHCAFRPLLVRSCPNFDLREETSAVSLHLHRCLGPSSLRTLFIGRTRHPFSGVVLERELPSHNGVGRQNRPPCYWPGHREQTNPSADECCIKYERRTSALYSTAPARPRPHLDGTCHRRVGGSGEQRD